MSKLPKKLKPPIKKIKNIAIIPIYKFVQAHKIQ